MKKYKKDDLVYVDDILSSIQKINRYCKTVAKNDFIKNDLLIDAVVRNLEIIGEASSKLTVSFGMTTALHILYHHQGRAQFR